MNPTQSLILVVVGLHLMMKLRGQLLVMKIQVGEEFVQKFVAKRLKDSESNIVTKMWNIQSRLDDVPQHAGTTARIRDTARLNPLPTKQAQGRTSHP
jgi:hypothetical protein